MPGINFDYRDLQLFAYQRELSEAEANNRIHKKKASFKLPPYNLSGSTPGDPTEDPGAGEGES